MQAADIIVWVSDVSQPAESLAADMQQCCQWRDQLNLSSIPLLLVLNKCDLVKAQRQPQLSELTSQLSQQLGARKQSKTKRLSSRRHRSTTSHSRMLAAVVVATVVMAVIMIVVVWVVVAVVVVAAWLAPRSWLLPAAPGSLLVRLSILTQITWLLVLSSSAQIGSQI